MTLVNEVSSTKLWKERMNKSSEQKYINKRLAKAKLMSLKFWVMRVFPINHRKIVFSTFEGDGGFCCNPRYIAQELHRRNPNYKMIWLTKKGKDEFPEYIKVVRYSPWRIAYHLSTSAVWIDNYRKPLGTIKRKGQLYIQTWHASIGFKPIGLFRGNLFPRIAQIVSERDSELIDYALSNSEFCDTVRPKELLFYGSILRAGSPRVDCIINEREKLYRGIREKYKISKSNKILLFAPTFRGGNQKGKKQVIAPIPTMDFCKLLDELEAKYDSSWNVFLRLHPQLSAQMEKMPLEKSDERFIDVSKAPDISELMAACDMVITDYSSCAFDAAFAKIPVLLYADDVQEYIENRGQFMWKRDELPFDIAENNDELIDNVRGFDYSEYLKRVDEFIKTNGVLEDGRASSRVAEKIEEILNSN